MRERLIRAGCTLCGTLLLSGWRPAPGRAATLPQPPPANPLAGVAESHIRGNVPAQPKFDKLLKRDLTRYFTKAGKAPTVEYEFLRHGPTQTGVAFPKYYLWVKVRHGRRLTGEGAVRVAAVGQKQFDVTDFLSIAEMRRNPSQIDTVFPREVGDRIRARLQQRKQPPRR